MRAGRVRHTFGKFLKKLQLCFRPRPNRKSEQRVIVLQSCGSPNRVVSGLFLGSPGTKNHLDVGAVGKHRENYMVEGSGIPRIRAVMSFMSPKLPVACLSTKGVLELY